MTGIFSEVETEMGQEREHREGRRGEARSQHRPLSQGPGAPAILSYLRLSVAPYSGSGPRPAATLEPHYVEMWTAPQDPLDHTGTAWAPEGWRLGCDSLVRWREEVGSIRGNGF